MYKHSEKNKTMKKSRAIANSVSQKNQNNEICSGLIDNRSGGVLQRTTPVMNNVLSGYDGIQKKINNMEQAKKIVPQDITQFLTDYGKLKDIDRLNYSELKMYHEEPDGVEMEIGELERIGERIGEIEGEAGVNVVRCGEGEIVKANHNQLIYYGGITSCMTITVILESGAKIAVHKSITHDVDNVLERIKGCNSESEAIEKVIIGGALDFWMKDLRPIGDMPAESTVGVWQASMQTDELIRCIKSGLGEVTVDILPWESGKYSVTENAEVFAGIREAKPMGEWIQAYCEEKGYTAVNANIIVQWLIDKGKLDVDDRVEAERDIKSFAKATPMYQHIVEDWQDV